MRRNLLSTVIGLIVIAFLIQLIPYGHNHTNPQKNVEPVWDSLNTRDLAQRTCFDCHSNQTVWPWYSNIALVSWLVYRDVTHGREHINFSDWDRPEPQHVDEFQEVFDDGSMPPATYLLLHPEARLSIGERQTMFNGLTKLAAAIRCLV